jgi:carboxypeptidase PM20D1
VDTPEFAALARAIRAVYPQVLVAPYLTIGATDSREYWRVAPDTYRFLPIYEDGALEAIHGIDEHVRIDAYLQAVRIYATLMTGLAGR